MRCSPRLRRFRSCDSYRNLYLWVINRMYSGQWWLPTPAFHYVLPLLVATCSFVLTLHSGKFNFGEGTLSFLVSEIPDLMNWISRAKFNRVSINSCLPTCISSNLNHTNQLVLLLRCLVEISLHDMLAFYWSSILWFDVCRYLNFIWEFPPSRRAARNESWALF